MKDAKPPKHLTPAAAKLWKSIADEIDLDTPALLLLNVLCESFDRREEARAAMAKGGAVVADRFGQLKPSPWMAIERDSTLALQRSWRLLGFDIAEPPK